MLKQNNRAQALLEYSLLIGVVIMVAMTMFVRVRRSTQSLIKVTADQIGNQQRAEQDYTVNDSIIVFSDTHSASKVNRESFDTAHKTSVGFNDSTSTNTVTLTNAGFTTND